MSLTATLWTVIGAATVSFTALSIVVISRISARDNAAEEAAQDALLEHRLASDLDRRLDYYVLWLNVDQRAAA